MKFIIICQEHLSVTYGHWPRGCWFAEQANSSISVCLGL